MSQYPFDQPQNPYAASGAATPSSSWQPNQNKRPTFCTVIFIMDLVFCCIRVLLVLIGIAGAMAIESGAVKIPMPTEFLWWEVYAGLGIVVLGVPANILLLMNKRAGVLLGYLTVVAVAASLSFWRCPT